MKSKFIKSMQLLWQASPTVEEDNTLREKEESPQDSCFEPALAKEYVRALAEEQIPQPLLDKMADLINESIPELVRQSIDKEAEKRNIYSHLSEPFIDYIRFIYEKIQTEGSAQWKQDETLLKAQVKELNEYIRELASKQEEFQNQYLSAERQKRALGERVHELEMRIVTFEAEKEQGDMEKSALNNKLKVAAVQEKNKQEELQALQEEKARLEQELAKEQRKDSEMPEKLREAVERAERLQQQLTDLSASRDIEVETIRTQLHVLSQELENQKNTNAALGESEKIKAGLESALSESENKILTLEQIIESGKQEIKELQSAIELLKLQSGRQEDEKSRLEALLNEKSSALKEQQALSEEIAANGQDIADLKHQLVVTNDMLEAVKIQRQELFSEIEKEKSGRTELHRKLLLSEETVRQYENDQQIDRKNIRALMAEIEALKEELKNGAQDSRFLDEPEELDWLVPTRPDTPEEIARKKAEKKLQEKEAMAEGEKMEVKPDPSQMSLW